MSEYCMLVKMEYSKRLLKDTNKKVYEICEELGYTTLDYFTRLFKNYTGCTPAYYRKYGDVVLEGPAFFWNFDLTDFTLAQ